jgi:hypothetical protein
MRYSRLFSLPNFQNERIELERDFPDDVTAFQAYLNLKEEVCLIHAKEKTALKMGIKLPYETP